MLAVAHLPLLVAAVASVLVIYLWRELQRAKKALREVSARPQEPAAAAATTARREPARRVRFQDETGRPKKPALKRPGADDQTRSSAAGADDLEQGRTAHAGTA